MMPASIRMTIDPRRQLHDDSQRSALSQGVRREGLADIGVTLRASLAPLAAPPLPGPPPLLTPRLWYPLVVWEGEAQKGGEGSPEHPADTGANIEVRQFFGLVQTFAVVNNRELLSSR